MPHIVYVEKNFSIGSTAIIDQANRILEEYGEQGYKLTLRQLYYQFVARGMIANKQTEYKRIGSIVNDARMAGLIDWDTIEDRTRFLRGLQHWDSPAEIIKEASENFRYDMWEGQPCRVEVWIEKDALIGVIESKCDEFDIPYFACRGYVSQSEAWRAGRRAKYYSRYYSQPTVILHMGDHDPSGIDMTRDNGDRLSMFSESYVDIRRLALNMHQVEQYGPPPNPAKLTDSRAGEYVQKYGSDSWELDALEPRVINQLIEDEINGIIDWDEWEATSKRQSEAKGKLQDLSNSWVE